MPNNNNSNKKRDNVRFKIKLQNNSVNRKSNQFSLGSRTYKLDIKNDSKRIEYFEQWIQEYCLVNYSISDCAVEILKLPFEKKHASIVHSELEIPDNEEIELWAKRVAKQLQLNGYFVFIFPANNYPGEVVSKTISSIRRKRHFQDYCHYDLMISDNRPGGYIIVQVITGPKKTKKLTNQISFGYFDSIETKASKNPQGTYSDYLIRKKYLT